MVHLSTSGRKALDDVVAKLAEANKIPGFALGATTAEGEIYFGTGGYKTLDDPASGKVDPDTVFWICSMTKLVAHIAALQLIEQGKLKEETPVSEYFPQFANPVVLDNIMSPSPSFKPAQNAVLVKHLLNFTSGLFYPMVPDFGIKVPHSYAGIHDQKDPHSDFFSLLKGKYPGIPLGNEPGTNFVYGYGSDILGFIVEKISGTTFEKYLQENVFKPLGMKASFYLTSDLKEKLLGLSLRTEDGQLHVWNNQPGTGLIERDPSKISRHQGGIGLYVSLRDYLKLLQHILQILGGKAADPILKRETAASMFVGVLNEDGVKNLDMTVGPLMPGVSSQWSNAFAVSTNDWPSRRKKGSGYWSGWAGTYFFIDPTTGIAVVYGTQLIGLGVGAFDPEILKGLTAFEEALYAGIDAGN
ncbi:beta-lactamase/transpeptidase-like protein [Pholiota molesta]|nr:beta-lactamase/transpeptidase-like protein [Pholiota molesta]